MVKENLAGKRFGKLTVVSPAPNKDNKTCWNCLCECGNYVTVMSNHLKIDRNKSNNTYVNLRIVTPSKNALNRDIDKRNTTGFLGVTKLNKKYRAAIMIDGINYRKSGFNTPEEAYKWRLQKEKEMMTYQ